MEAILSFLSILSSIIFPLDTIDGNSLIFVGRSMRDTKTISINSSISDVYGSKYFKCDDRTVVYFHDWQSGPNNQSALAIVDAFQEHGDFNIIIANWTGAAKDKKYHQFVDSIQNVSSLKIFLM